MRREMKWRYYCEFCKKSGASAYHIAKHERNCTANPNRTCGFCDVIHVEPKPVSELVKALGRGDEAGMQALRDLTGECPGCMLAALRQGGFTGYNYDCDPEGYGAGPAPEPLAWETFNFRQAKTDFWDGVNTDMNERGDW